MGTDWEASLMHFHWCLGHPRGRPHVAAFIAMIECGHDGLTPLGHHVTIAENRWEAGAINVCFGAHHLAQIGAYTSNYCYWRRYSFLERQPWDPLALRETNPFGSQKSSAVN